MRQRTPSTDVSAALLSAAEAVLERDGLAGLTIRAVVSEAGVAPMGVYSRYGGKPGLIDALLSRGFVQLKESIEGASGTGLVRLRSAGLAYRTFALSHQHLYALMFNHPEALARSEETLANAVRSFDALVQIVSDAMARGELAQTEPVEVAQAIWSAVHGAVSLELVGIGFTSDRVRTYASMMDAIIDGFAEPT